MTLARFLVPVLARVQTYVLFSAQKTLGALYAPGTGGDNNTVRGVGKCWRFPVKKAWQLATAGRGFDDMAKLLKKRCVR